MFKIPLNPASYPKAKTVVASSVEFTVTGWTYPSGVAAIEVANSRGRIEILPFLGQIIWDAWFDGRSLTMKNMFNEPKPASVIVDTYGCFAFHSGLLAAGCPAPEDSHPLHGEFPCAPFEQAWVEISPDAVAVSGRYEYVQGFGHHYQAIPTVRLAAGESEFDIDLEVTNLSAYQPMPLQYMCHMNYAYVAGASFGGNLPDDAFKIRQSIPAHVTPTEPWREFIAELAHREAYTELTEPERYDPEIVWFADDLPRYGEEIEVTMDEFFVRFAAQQFPVATRWVLHNPDQQVAAFALPGTSRPEGFEAAKAAGTLINLKAGETQQFHVRTGLKG